MATVKTKHLKGIQSYVFHIKETTQLTVKANISATEKVVMF